MEVAALLGIDNVGCATVCAAGWIETPHGLRLPDQCALPEGSEVLWRIEAGALTHEKREATLEATEELFAIRAGRAQIGVRAADSVLWLPVPENGHQPGRLHHLGIGAETISTWPAACPIAEARG